MTQDTPCHLCVAHSPLVTHVFEAAMRQQGVSKDVVRSIARRGVPFSGKGLCLDEVSDELESCFKRFDRKGYAKARSRMVADLNRLTAGRFFEAYIPHLNKILYQEIVFHPLCSGYSFLEEGFTSMAWETWPNIRSNWPKILRNYLRTWWVGPSYFFKRPMFEHFLPHYQAAYAISKHAFYDMPGKIDVAAHLPHLPCGDGPVITYVILDASYLHQGICWQTYEKALVDAVLKHAPPYAEICIKFHFADSQALKRFQNIRERLAERGLTSARLLESDFSVEANLTRQDLLLFAVTSLGYYAALAGAKVRCFAENIEDLSLSSWIGKSWLPADFLSVVGIAADSKLRPEDALPQRAHGGKIFH